MIKQNPELKTQIDEQAAILQQIRRKKFQDEQSKSDAEFARKLQEQESQKSQQKRARDLARDEELARRLNEKISQKHPSRPQIPQTNSLKTPERPRKSPLQPKKKIPTPGKSNYSPVVKYSPPPTERFFERRKSPPITDRKRQEIADELFAKELQENEQFHFEKQKSKSKTSKGNKTSPKIDKYYHAYGVKRARVSSSDSDSSIYGTSSSRPKKTIRIGSSDSDDQTQLPQSGMTSNTVPLFINK